MSMSRTSETTHGALTIRAGILVQQSSRPAYQHQLWPAWGHWSWCLGHQLPPPGQTQTLPPVPRAPLEPDRNLGRRRFRAQAALAAMAARGQAAPSTRGRMSPQLKKQQCKESPAETQWRWLHAKELHFCHC